MSKSARPSTSPTRRSRSNARHCSASTPTRSSTGSATARTRSRRCTRTGRCRPLMPPSPQHDGRIHPVSGRRRSPDHPKGRQIDPAALAEVQALLGEREPRRDLLIEHLHLLQDHFGCLHAHHLAALAEEMRLALVEVYEVASFYAHFDIVMDGEAPPPPITVRVCDSLSCEIAGAQQLLTDLETRLAPGVRVVRASDLAA